MPEKNSKHIHMILVWSGTLIIYVKNSTLSTLSISLFKECFASKQFLEIKGLLHNLQDKCLKFMSIRGIK